jgi:hypothetical protein
VLTISIPAQAQNNERPCATVHRFLFCRDGPIGELKEVPIKFENLDAFGQVGKTIEGIFVVMLSEIFNALWQAFVVEHRV